MRGSGGGYEEQKVEITLEEGSENVKNQTQEPSVPDEKDSDEEQQDPDDVFGRDPFDEIFGGSDIFGNDGF